jgi:hypothetical protein
MNSVHPTIKELGLEIPCSQETEILKKILSDNFMTLRAQELMVGFFAPEVIRRMNPLERGALVKRIAPPKQERPRVTWAIDKTPVGQEWFIFAGLPNQAVHFTGTPEQARTWKFSGESVPKEILDEYARVYRPHALIASEEYARAAKQEWQDKSHVPGPEYVPRFSLLEERL